MIKRRLLLGIIAAAMPMLVTAQTSDWPNRPIRFVVPLAAGGPADTVARILAKELSTSWKPVVVENLGGGGSTIGSAAVARAQPDGHTFLVGIIAHATNPSLLKNVPYHYRNDFTPVSKLVDMVSVIVANPTFPPNTLPQFIKYAKDHPGKVVWALGSVGSTEHLAGAMLSSRANVEFLQVPYRGASLAMNDLVAGQADFKIESIATALGFIQAKKLKPIATTHKNRSPLLPDVPTVGESGFPGFDATAWVGLFGPAKLPKPIAEEMAQRVNSALNKPEVVKQLAQMGAQVDTIPTARFGKFVDDQHDQWAKLIKEMKIKTSE